MARVKIRRKDLRQPDEFMELTGRVWKWLVENRLQAGLVVGGVVAILLGVSGVRQYLDYRARTAATAFGKALTLYSKGSSSAAVDAFAAVPQVGAYPSLGNLYRGHAALKAKDFGIAVDAFRAAASQGDLPAYLRQEAHYNLAFSLSALEDREGALAAYETAAQIRGPFQAEARLGAARLSEALGDVDKARALYQDTIRDIERVGALEDDLRTIAEWRLEGLKDPAVGSE